MAFFRRTKKVTEDNEAPMLPQTRRAVFFDVVKVSQIYKEYPSQSALINSFRRRTGYTIVQYLGIKKMEYAAQMLRDSKNNVTDIAAAVGVSSLSHFIHKFKEHFGITPKEYQLLHSVDSAANSRQKPEDGTSTEYNKLYFSVRSACPRSA